SLGLFQQRPSQGWGNADQILNPAYAATQFYQHLLAVPKWQQMALTEAAQAVQNSGAPDAYARHEQGARQIVGALSGVACADHPQGRACDIMLNANNQQSVADGWRIANWLATNQAQLGVHYLIWQGQYWSADAPTWVLYRSDAYGCPNPANLTGCHYDHIHIS